MLNSGLDPANAISYSTPADAGKITALSRAISQESNIAAGAILIVEQTGVWPSSENMYLAEMFRKAFGEVRPIREAPVHLFSAAEQDSCSSMLSLCFFNFWDFTLISTSLQVLVRGSHDEFIEVQALHVDDRNKLIKQMQQLGLEEITTAPATMEGNTGTTDLLAQIDELQRSISSRPGDTSLSRKLARSLYEMVVETQELDHPRFLDQLRLLAFTNKEDPIIREYLARGLYATLYNAFQEQATSLAKALLTEIREIAHRFSEDRILPSILAQALFVSLQAQSSGGNGEADALRHDLDQLARSYPDDPDVQRWAQSMR